MDKMNKGKFALLLRVLQEEYRSTMNGFRVIGFIHNNQTAIVELKGLTYYMWNNGGELGIEVVNARYNDNNILPKFIPLTDYSSKLNELTMAYRCSRVFNGEPIDYSYIEVDENQKAYIDYLKINDIENYEFSL